MVSIIIRSITCPTRIGTVLMKLLTNFFSMLVVGFLLSGCTAHVKTVGSFDNFNEIFVGDIAHNVLVGGSTITAETKNSDIRCTGRGWGVSQPNAFSCEGALGKAYLECSDGRIVNIDYVTTKCSAGYGHGSDQHGNRFRMVFGLDEEEARAELEKKRVKVAAKPDLPVYRPKEFREEHGFSTGTGFFITDDGYMVTNYHVIEGASSVMVFDTGTKKEWAATVNKTDPLNDIAILKVNVQTKAIPLSNGFNAMKGEEVLTLGYPVIILQGQEQKATFGRINALSGPQGDIRFVQVDIPIQPGNSGGPLLNSKGEAIGIITSTLSQIVAIKASGRLPQNVNYAVKIDYVFPLLHAERIEKSRFMSATVSKPASMAEVVAQRETAVMLVIAK